VPGTVNEGPSEVPRRTNSAPTPFGE
jgi:hypothetical protein